MRKPLRYILVAFIFLLLLAAGGVYFLYRASQHVPEFYAEVLKVAPETQEKESDAMLQQATTLQNDLQRKGHWQQVIKATTINAWLAVDLPRNHPNLLPAGMHDPRVCITSQGITAACQVERGRFHGVVSLAVSAFVESADTVGLRIRAARLGAVPLSLKQVLDGISEAAKRSGVHLVWRQIDGDPVALITLTPADGRHRRIVHIDTIQLDEGQMIVAGTTEAAK